MILLFIFSMIYNVFFFMNTNYHYKDIECYLAEGEHRQE